MNKICGKTIYLFVLSVVMGLSVGGAAAQQTAITKRVGLTAKANRIELKGTLPEKDLTRVYVVRAAKNQRLKVSITFTARRGEADFSLKCPDGKDVDEANIINDEWEGVLPQTGDYKINVFNPAKIRGVVRYTLTISLR